MIDDTDFEKLGYEPIDEAVFYNPKGAGPLQCVLVEAFLSADGREWFRGIALDECKNGELITGAGRAQGADIHAGVEVLIPIYAQLARLKRFVGTHDAVWIGHPSRETRPGGKSMWTFKVGSTRLTPAQLAAHGERIEAYKASIAARAPVPVEDTAEFPGL